MKVDGFTITEVELGAAASTRFSGGTTETWVFDDEAAADAWLEEHRAPCWSTRSACTTSAWAVPARPTNAPRR